MDQKIESVIEAAKMYEKWARESGDYPPDEQGCEAHDAIIKAVRALGQHSAIDTPPRHNP